MNIDEKRDYVAKALALAKELESILAEVRRLLLRASTALEAGLEKEADRPLKKAITQLGTLSLAFAKGWIGSCTKQ